jgi:hypothetical protein
MWVISSHPAYQEGGEEVRNMMVSQRFRIGGLALVFGAIASIAYLIDIDIWPTPFTNSFSIRREPLAVGERREFRIAWVAAPELTFHPQLQAYTRLADQRYRYESLDGSGFSAKLPVDADGLVLDYPGLFRRVPVPG